MDNRSAVHALWRAARDGLARLNQRLAESDPADEAIFSAPSRGRQRTDEVERRIAEARKARIGG